MAAKQALGRGLKALMPEAPRARAGLAEIPIDNIRPNPNQPRTHFDPDGLAELAASLTEHGLLQPLLVSEDGDGGYLIIAGERRWRAAKLAGLPRVAAVIRERVDKTAELELALVENLQRRDLTPLEEARAYEQLRASSGLSQADIARRVGLDRSTVANALRLLKLEPELQELVEQGALSAGHARALLAFPDTATRTAWARRVVETGASVRDIETAAAAVRDDSVSARRAPRPKPPKKDPNLAAAEEKLSLKLGARVEIRTHRRGGAVLISCATQEDLMRVFDRLMETS